MKYTVTFTERAQKQLYKLDPNTFKILTNWIQKNLEGCEDPRLKGKALVGDRSGQWRYRVGDYRIITEIHDSEVTILVLEVGHRKSIYN